jgi:guanylate kinase
MRKYKIFFDLITTTTRKPRINDGLLERDGIEYYFVTEEEFFNKIKNGQLMEWAVIHNQQLSGSDINKIKEAIKLNKVIINDVTPDGLLKFQQYSSNVRPILIIPPSFKEWQRRLQVRGILSNEEIKNRMLSAKNEIIECLHIKDLHFVINDDLEKTCEDIYRYITSGAQFTQDKQARWVASKILNSL